MPTSHFNNEIPRGPGHGSSEVPCRSCLSFKEYMKQSKVKYDSQKTVQEVSHETEFVMPENCPLDKDQLGRSTWGFLHTMAARYPNKPSIQQQQNMKQFIQLFSEFYPCDFCAADLREDLKVLPPKTESQDALSQWLCKIHNKVNVKLGKQEFDCSKVNERWRDGWLNGSCG